MLTGPLQLDRLLDEVEAASAAYLFDIAAVNREQTALRRTIFVYAASGSAVAVLLQEGALEKYLAARAATVTVAAPQRERLDHLVVLEAYAYEAPKLAVRLTRAEL